ncbi:DUF6088 family protein [Sedimentitalea sp.]|uniref:DUF6088 family protein n=1 Tax=Sedimentitalea sp. TaxID=2048915 RepID=UPI00329720B7
MIAAKIKKRIVGKGRGAVFAPSDFLDLGSRASVDQALSRLADQDIIRRLTRGLYDYPKVSDRFGKLAPSLDDVAQAVARKDNQTLQISPARAANQLGLSTQVPSHVTYLTDGPTRKKQIGNQTIHFRKAAQKTLVGAGQKTGTVFQALRYVGKDRVTDTVVRKLAGALDSKDRARLVKQSRHVPAWMHPVVQQIAAYAG